MTKLVKDILTCVEGSLASSYESASERVAVCFQSSFAGESQAQRQLAPDLMVDMQQLPCYEDLLITSYNRNLHG